jgi:hypothetical protein
VTIPVVCFHREFNNVAAQPFNLVVVVVGLCIDVIGQRERNQLLHAHEKDESGCMRVFKFFNREMSVQAFQGLDREGIL